MKLNIPDLGKKLSLVTAGVTGLKKAEEENPSDLTFIVHIDYLSYADHIDIIARVYKRGSFITDLYNRTSHFEEMSEAEIITMFREMQDILTVNPAKALVEKLEKELEEAKKKLN